MVQYFYVCLFDFNNYLRILIFTLLKIFSRKLIYLTVYCIICSLQVEGSIDVNINAEGTGEETVQAKEKPIWLSDATSLITTNITSLEPSVPQVTCFSRSALSLFYQIYVNVTLLTL